MADRSVSSSEQYTKRSNRFLLLLGLGVMILFLVTWCTMDSNNRKKQQFEQNPIGVNEVDDKVRDMLPEARDFGDGVGQLEAQPTSVSMDSVVLGSQAEAVVILTAKQNPIHFIGMDFAEEQQDGFTVGGTCEPNMSIPRDGSCIVKVMWNPTALRQIQNQLNIRWRVDSPSVFTESILSIPVRGQSTDSKDCVICEVPCKDESAKQVKEAALFSGEVGEVDKDGVVIIDGKKYTVKDGLLYDENGNIVGAVEPDKIPIDLNNKLMGKIADNGDVLGHDGVALGRLVGDGTIVDSSLKVLGAAVPVVSVMDFNGRIIGKMNEDGTVVDGSGTVIGKPLVDGSVADLENNLIGYLRPYGLVVNWTGDVVGGILPNGSIVNGNKQVVGMVKPNGLAVNPDGELIGGTIPKGVVVGGACKSMGRVMMNGQVKDNYSQIIGKTLFNGSVIDERGMDIGTVVRQGLVINEKGNIVGFVNSEGKAVDAKGAVIGCVNPDGTVSAGSKMIGGVMPKGRVIGRGCQVIGSVYPNGVVMNDSVEVVGQVRPDSYVVNVNNRIIGVVVSRGAAIADGCRLLGLITPDGQVVDANGLNIGCMTLEKQIINKQEEVIGFVAPMGLVVDKAGKVIGRARPDGKVIDNDGKVIGCVNSDGSVVGLDGKTIIGQVVGGGNGAGGSVAGGVILDENGNPTGWRVVGNEVFDENGNKIGTLMPNGWVVNDRGEIQGVIPPDGVIFAHDGTILGRYSRQTGAALTMAGDKFGIVLPDYSVLNLEKDIVIGLLVPDGTSFMDMKGSYVGTMNVEGALNGSAGESIGQIRSNGTVVDRAGQTVGVRIPQGKVFSIIGEDIGTVNDKGEVVSATQSVIGRVLGNGIVLSKDGRVLGGVFPDISSAIGADGLMGALTYQGRINDTKGRQMGIASPFGSVFGEKENVVGRLVRIGPYMDSTGKLIGWANFKGGLNDKKGETIGTISVAGVALDTDNKVLGALIPRGVVVSDKGKYLSAVFSDGRVVSATGDGLGIPTENGYVTSEKSGLTGRVLAPGVAVSAEGGFLGWTRYDGTVEDARSVVGHVALSNAVVKDDGTVIGTYIPLGSLAMTEKSGFMGIVDGLGQVVTRKGTHTGTITNDTFVVENGRISGRLMCMAPAVTNEVTGQLSGMTGADGVAMVVNDTKPLGRVMANGLVADLTKKVVGGLAPYGLAVGTKLDIMGISYPTGEVMSKGAVAGHGVGTGSNTVYLADGQIIGGVRAPATFIDRNGAVIGQSSGTAAIFDKDGKKLGSYMPFGTALTPDTIWAGGAMPVGQAINDDGLDIGVAALDGTISGKEGMMMGRILSDGSAVGLSDKTVFSTMPYIGHTIKQGLPFGYKNVILGRTTVVGDIIDASDKKVYRELDDGTILGTDMPLDGAVLSFNPATNHEGKVLGMLDGEGSVMSYAGEDKGKIAVNGAVKGNHKYRILGALVPEPLVAHDCKVLGQTSQNGQIINGQGNVVGRIAPDKSAVDSANNKIGRSVRVGLVASPTGDYLGRTLPDSTVVNLEGVNMGCARDDGSVVDNSGKVIGYVVERGLVLDEKGNPIGRVKADGTVVDKTGKVIGKVLGDGKGTVVDNEGRVIGRVVTPDEELMFNKDGTIAGTFRRDGMFKDPQGREQFQVLPDGRIIDPKTGRQIGTLTEDGRLLDMNGNEISDIRVLRDKDGNFIGLVDDDGNILDFDGNVIGRVLPDGTIVDNDGNVIGKINPDGSVDFGEDGIIRLPNGMYIKDGKLYDKDGNLIGYVDENGNIYDKDGNLIGRINPDGSVTLFDKDQYTIKDGIVYDKDGNIIGYVGPDGFIRDKDGNIIGRLNPDGSITWFNNGSMGSLSGDWSSLTPDLKKNVGAGSAGLSGRRLFLGGNVFDVTPQGSLIDKDGNIIGYMGDDGRPYSVDGQLLGGGSDSSKRPDTKKPTVVNPEQREAMDQLLATRRAAMKNKIRSFERMLPDARTLARGRKKEDRDWGEAKIVSSYPVDMSRMILKDKAIPAVLAHSVDSRFPDVPVTAIVERHIYAEQGRRIIIPAGSRLIGTCNGESEGGGSKRKHVNKMTFTWNRLIRPDGSAFKFDATSGDAQGRGGVAAYLDEQLLKKYGKPVLQSTLTSAVAFLTATNDDVTTKENGDQVQSSRAQAASDARSNFIDSMSQIFQQLLDESMEVDEVVFVPAGTRLTVFSNADLWLRSEMEDEDDYVAAFGADAKDIQGSSQGNWIDPRSNEVAEKAAQRGINSDMGAVAATEESGEYYDPEYGDEGQAGTSRGETIYNGEVESSAPVTGTEPPKASSKPGKVATPIFPKAQQNPTSKKLF